MIFEDNILPLRRIGKLRQIPSLDIRVSGVSVDLECLDRKCFDFDHCVEPLGADGGRLHAAPLRTGGSRRPLPGSGAAQIRRAIQWTGSLER